MHLIAGVYGWLAGEVRTSYDVIQFNEMTEIARKINAANVNRTEIC